VYELSMQSLPQRGHLLLVPVYKATSQRITKTINRDIPSQIRPYIKSAKSMSKKINDATMPK